MPLKTEQNTRTIERSIRGAFRAWAHQRVFNTVFEHGQWWVIQPETKHDDGGTFSVCDATGGDSVNGFSFERV